MIIEEQTTLASSKEAELTLATSKEADLASALMATRAFQRLRSIRFLGAIDYTLVRTPNGAPLNVRHTRHEHSMCVAALAMRYAAYVNLDATNRRLACAAALLHDIGHAPLSHSLEPIFKREFGLDHHKATENVITGSGCLGREVKKTLQDFCVEPESIISILNGDYDPCGGFFSGPINFDTIEGILRTRRYVTRAVSGLTSLRVVIAATDRNSNDDQDAVDAFWHEKNEVYARIIRSSEGVLADHLCQTLALRYVSRLKASDYLTTETTIFNKLPEMRDALRLGIRQGLMRYNIALPDEYISRNFYVNRLCSFFSRNDQGRYSQLKSVRPFAVSLPQQAIIPTGKQLEMLPESSL